MKIKIALPVLIILAFAAFTACKKTGGINYNMGATIGNSPYAANNCIARPQGSALVILGVPSGSTVPVPPYISIVIANWHDAIDSFKLDSTQRGNFAQYYSSNTDFKMSQSGVVVINTINSDNISGVFQFMTTDSTEITGGTFVAKRMP